MNKQNRWFSGITLMLLILLTGCNNSLMSRGQIKDVLVQKTDLKSLWRDSKFAYKRFSDMGDIFTRDYFAEKVILQIDLASSAIGASSMVEMIYMESSYPPSIPIPEDLASNEDTYQGVIGQISELVYQFEDSATANEVYQIYRQTPNFILHERELEAIVIEHNNDITYQGVCYPFPEDGTATVTSTSPRSYWLGNCWFVAQLENYVVAVNTRWSPPDSAHNEHLKQILFEAVLNRLATVVQEK